jgi:nitroreductase
MSEIKIIESILKRRSIRKYEDRPVEREKLLACVEAARLAPSACNGQPWKYIVVDDADVKHKLAKEAFSGVYVVTSFAAKAGAIVAITSEPAILPSMIGDNVRDTKFYLADLGISMAHFCLQAQALGLGTCMLGWFNHEKAAKVLNVPKKKKIEFLISIGYPAQSPDPRSRKKIEKMSSFNTY